MSHDVNVALWLLDEEVSWMPSGDWCLVGSIVLYLHHLREEVGDIDLFVTKNGYDGLRERGWTEVVPNPDHPPMLERYLNEVRVNAWYEWAHPQHVQVTHVLDEQETLHGWPVMRLETLRAWKAALMRPKDVRDIAAIDERFG